MEEQTQALTLPEDCDTQWASRFHDMLGSILAGQPNISLQAGEVRRINTPAIQLLLALARLVESKGCRFEIQSPSAIVETAFADLGLAAVLANWSAPSHG